jgi:purine-binding chemotaxis protein CheW
MVRTIEMPAVARKVRTGKHVAFDLAGDTFAVEAARVRDLCGAVEVLPVPRRPAFFRGVANLWGSIVPIMDLRLKLGRPAAPDNQDSALLVVIAHGMDMGLVVDRVGELFHVHAHTVEEIPSFAAPVRPDFADGAVRCGDRSAVLLDLDRLLHPDEWAAAPDLR